MPTATLTDEKLGEGQDSAACRFSLQRDREGTSEIFVRRIDPISREKAIDQLNEWTEGLTAKVALLNQSTLDLNVALMSPSPDTAELVNMETRLLGEVVELRMLVREGERDLRELYGVQEIPRMDPPVYMTMVDRCDRCKAPSDALILDDGVLFCGPCFGEKE